MKAKIQTIETWLCVFPGFYGTIFEANEEDEVCSQNQERDSSLPEIEYDDLDFNNQEYELDVVKQCTSFIEDQLKELGMVTAIRLQSVRSPREYNFLNDSGNIEIDLTNKNLKAIKAYIYSHIDEYEEYLKRYQSRSGFSSYYDPNFESWREYTENFMNYSDNAHHLGSVLEFICRNEGWDSETMYDYAMQDIYVSMYCKDRSDQVKCEDCGEWYAAVFSPEHDEYDRLKKTQAAIWKETQGDKPYKMKSFEECYPDFSFKWYLC